MELLGAYESTYLPRWDVDIAELNGHARRWASDLLQLRELGVVRLRYPVRWHRIERRPGRYDWRETDTLLGHLDALGMRPIVDLVHHTSYPRWLRDGLLDADFAPSFLAFTEAFARRYPSTPEYTLFNEPFATLFLAGHEGIWPPHGRGIGAFVRLLRSVLPAVAESSRRMAELLPHARHVWVDTCEHHTGTPGAPLAYASLANDRRFAVLDLVLGRAGEISGRPFLRDLVAAGGGDLLDIAPGRVDVLGLDYYPHSEWHFDERGGHAPSPSPLGLAALASQYAERYGLPLLVSETNIRGFPSDRASWLRYVLEQCELATERGVRLEGVCWFPSVDSCDWDSLLARPARRVDPVGVFSLTATGGRRATSMSRSFRAAVAGAPSADLPAYRFQSPARERLHGYRHHTAHWNWEDPPANEVVEPSRLPALGEEVA